VLKSSVRFLLHRQQNSDMLCNTWFLLQAGIKTARQSWFLIFGQLFNSFHGGLWVGYSLDRPY
jgi:hypothetical protein